MIKVSEDKLLNTEEYEKEAEQNLDYLLEEDEEEEVSGIVKLKTPVVIEGEEAKEIPYDFSTVKAIQYINLKKRLSKKKNIPIPELDSDVQLGYFALASGVPVSDLKRIEDTRDYVNITSRVRDFLLQN